VEMGSHEQLLNKGGAYAELYALQFKDTDQSVYSVEMG